jgi:hypothetical protein
LIVVAVFCVAAGILVGVVPKPVAETGAIDFVLKSTNFCISAQVLFWYVFFPLILYLTLPEPSLSNFEPVSSSYFFAKSTCVSVHTPFGAAISLGAAILVIFPAACVPTSISDIFLLSAAAFLLANANAFCCAFVNFLPLVLAAIGATTGLAGALCVSGLYVEFLALVSLYDL